MTTNEKLRDELLKANGMEGFEIDKEIQKDHPYNDEVALLRKEIKHIAEQIPVNLSAEFVAYYAEAERKKAEVKERLK